MPGSVTDLLRPVCDFFGVGPLLRFTDAGGYANRNLVVETGRGSYLVKILREHGPDALESEALYLERIASTGFPAPTYLTGRDGNRIYEREGELVALMPFLEGEVSDDISRPRLESLGAALARLHLIDDGGSLPPRKTWWHSGFLGDGLARCKRRFGDQALARLEGQIAALADLEAEDLPRSIVHGDPWPGNAIFQGPRLVALVDWEETALGFPVFDLAYLAIHGCLSGRTFEPRDFDSLVESYQSVRKLSPRERRCFGPSVRRVACVNYLWLLLREEPDRGGLERLWASQWYRGLELDRLTLAP